jgi:hypothetical protein
VPGVILSDAKDLLARWLLTRPTSIRNFAHGLDGWNGSARRSGQGESPEFRPRVAPDEKSRVADVRLATAACATRSHSVDSVSLLVTLWRVGSEPVEEQQILRRCAPQDDKSHRTTVPPYHRTTVPPFAATQGHASHGFEDARRRATSKIRQSIQGESREDRG